MCHVEHGGFPSEQAMLKSFPDRHMWEINIVIQLSASLVNSPPTLSVYDASHIPVILFVMFPII